MGVIRGYTGTYRVSIEIYRHIGLYKNSIGIVCGLGRVLFVLQISPLMQNQMEKKRNFDYTVARGPELPKLEYPFLGVPPDKNCKVALVFG